MEEKKEVASEVPVRKQLNLKFSDLKNIKFKDAKAKGVTWK
ncbi:hypothetical protein [Clostridium sp. DMHC 10]|nr:hypothetical protein [Clostridium sp. DMHC 10]